MSRLTSSPIKSSLIAILSTAFLIAPALLPAQMQTPPKSQVPMTMLLGQPRSVQVAKAFGMLTDSLPIVVAPGRRGIEPHMSLTYSSGGENGMLGLGWDLNLGFIQLNRRNGLPASGNPDTYNFSIAALSGELHNDGTGVYHSCTELVYREFRKTSGGGWEMRDGQGNRYLFGSSSQSDLVAALWLLDTITDPSGNQITVNYMQNSGAFYPYTIAYTGFNGVPGPNRVLFSYQSRPDVHISYQHGVNETRTLRLAAIESDAGVLNYLVRRYVFNYGLTSSGQSVVSQIILVGADSDSSIVLRSMTYSTFARGWEQTSTSRVTPDFIDPGNGSDLGERLVDLDGDGCMDVVLANGTVLLGDCAGNFGEGNSSVWTAALQTRVALPPIVSVVSVDSNGNQTTADQGVRFVDVNGDGRTDVLIANSSRSEVWLNTYDGVHASTIGWQLATDLVLNNWVLPQSETSIDPATGTANCSATIRTDPFPFAFEYSGTDNNGNSVPGAPTGVFIADVNGDGLPDIVWSMRQDTGSGSYCIAAVYLNYGGGWLGNPVLSTASKLGVFSYTNPVPYGMDVVDMNGDGKADFVFAPASSGSSSVCLATGSGWNCANSYTFSIQGTQLTSVDSSGTPTGLQYVDYNHDGLPDVVVANEGSPIKVFQNTGTGFLEDTAMEGAWANLPDFVGTVGTNSHAQTANLADLNGDGVTDIVNLTDGLIYLGGVCPSPVVGCVLTPSGGVLPEGMLLQSATALGENVTIAYDHAPLMPLPMFVPITVSRTDIRKDQTSPPTYTCGYTYTSPQFTNREFLGFYEVQEAEPNGTTTSTIFNQQELFVGQELSVSVTNFVGFQYYYKVNTYTSTKNVTNPDIQQGMLATTDETFSDPTASYTSHVGYLSYDDRIDLMAVYKNPNTSVTGSDLTMTYTYARNDNTAIWNVPASINIFKGTTQTEVSSTQFFYDNQPAYNATRGLLTSTQDLVALTPTPKNITRSSKYDKYGNVLSVTDGDGFTSTWVYDAPTSSYRVSATDAAGHTVQSTFDAGWGAVLTDTDPSANVTTFQYDVFGRLKEVIKPGDSTVVGGTTNYTYSVMPPGTSGVYVTRSDAATSGGPRLQSVDYFDAFGQVYMNQRSGPGGTTINTTTTYDDMSLPMRISRPYFSGNTPVYTSLTRDQMHRITVILDSDGHYTARSYAALQVTETDRRGLTSVTLMNPQQQVVKRTLPNGTGMATTQYFYNVLNELTQVKRNDGTSTTMTYDLVGRKTSIVDPNAGTFHYAYDNEGHLKTLTDPNGHAIKYAYDHVGDLISRTYADGTKATAMYGGPASGNAVGRLMAVIDAAGTLSINYDTRGRVIQRNRNVLANGKMYTVRYAYDSADRVTSMTYPDGVVVKYGYDGGGNVVSVSDGMGNNIANAFAYTASGRLTGLKYGNGTYSSYVYDVMDRMTTLESFNPSSAAMQNMTYAYDGDSNITSIQDAVYGHNQQFTYDTMNRLTGAVGAGYGTENYTYDAVGNLLTKGSAAFMFSPNHHERAICRIINSPNLYPDPPTSCNPANVGTTVMTYDTRGNMTQMGSLQYAYDFENRLTTESNGSTLLQTNVYDFWGDRVVQTTPTETRVFIDGIFEDGANGTSDHIKTPTLLLATNLKPPAKAAASAKVNPQAPLPTMQAGRPTFVSPSTWFAMLLGLTMLTMLFGSVLRVTGRKRSLKVGIGIPRIRFSHARTGIKVMALSFGLVTSTATDSWAMTPPEPPAAASARASSSATAAATGQQRFFYHLNHLGGVNLVTNSAGNVVQILEYKPFGETYETSGSVTMPFGFDGQRLDGSNATTGLYYFNSRFYNPEIGRFMSADSVMDRPTIPQTLHHYAFAGDNPVRYVDPSGHSWWDFLIAAAIFTAIVVLAAVSGGSDLALVSIAMGVVGLGAGAAVGAGLCYSPTSEDFWQIAVTGALLGAAVGAGFGQMAGVGQGEVVATEAVEEAAEGAADGADGAAEPPPSQAAKSPPKWYTSNVNSALKSMAFGGPQTVMIHELQGGSTDSLLLDTSIGLAGSAISGATVGRLSGDALDTVLSKTGWSAVTITASTDAAGVLIQGAMYTFAGLEKQSLPHYVYSEAFGSRTAQSSSQSEFLPGYDSSTSYYSDVYKPGTPTPTPY